MESWSAIYCLSFEFAAPSLQTSHLYGTLVHPADFTLICVRKQDLALDLDCTAKHKAKLRQIIYKKTVWHCSPLLYMQILQGPGNCLDRHNTAQIYGGLCSILIVSLAEKRAYHIFILVPIVHFLAGTQSALSLMYELLVNESRSVQWNGPRTKSHKLCIAPLFECSSKQLLCGIDEGNAWGVYLRKAKILLCRKADQKFPPFLQFNWTGGICNFEGVKRLDLSS